MILPSFFMIALAYVSMQDRLTKEQKMINEYKDIKKVLGSLSQGVALTVDFPLVTKMARISAMKAYREQQKKMQKEKSGGEQNVVAEGDQSAGEGKQTNKLIMIEDLESGSPEKVLEAAKEAKIARKESMRVFKSIPSY